MNLIARCGDVQMIGTGRMAESEQLDSDRSGDAPREGVPLEPVVREIVDRIVEQVHPRRIILFGSLARQEQISASDVDLLVVVPEGVHKRQTAQMLYRHLRGPPVPVDILVISEADLDRQKDNPGLIYRTILQEGRELYAA